jgi:hypothetical protein
MSYEYGQQNVGFGEYSDADVATDAKSTAIKSVGRFAGMLARAFLLRRAQSSGGEDAVEGFGEVRTPCPDAAPGEAPDETPCAKKAAALRAKAAAWRAARRAGR